MQNLYHASFSDELSISPNLSSFISFQISVPPVDKYRSVGRAVTRLPRSGSSEIQISGRSNQTHCCQRLATAATFLQKKLRNPGAMTWRWAPPTRYTLRRNTASIMKDLILI